MMASQGCGGHDVIAGAPIRDLERDEIVTLLEQAANDRLGITAEEMLRLYGAGDLEDPGRVGDLLALADLLPEDDPVLAP